MTYTEYQELMEKSDYCEGVAMKKEGELKTFWHNASEGFKQKALKGEIDGEEENKDY